MWCIPGCIMVDFSYSLCARDFFFQFLGILSFFSVRMYDFLPSLFCLMNLRIFFPQWCYKLIPALSVALNSTLRSVECRVQWSVHNIVQNYDVHRIFRAHKLIFKKRYEKRKLNIIYKSKSNFSKNIMKSPPKIGQFKKKIKEAKNWKKQYM